MALSGKKSASFLWPGLVVGVWYKLELRQREHGGAVRIRSAVIML